MLFALSVLFSRFCALCGAVGGIPSDGVALDVGYVPLERWFALSVALPVLYIP